MTETLDFETWDVFTERRFAGNPLAVIFEADALDSETMLAITREFDYSESVFVLAPDAEGADARLRIFTPGGELPFAGHPTVGAACAIANRRDAGGALALDLKAGRFPVKVGGGDAAWHAEFANPNLPRVHSDGPATDAVETALGLPEASVDDGAQKPRRAGAGIDFVYAAASLETVRRARLNTTAWHHLGIDDACGLLLYAPVDDGSSDATWHVRMFGPHIGVAEDPATGSAAAGLPAQLLAAGTLAEGSHDWIVEQGVEMGRPSRIRVRFEVSSGAIEALRVAGHAVPMMAGRLRFGN
ncbi:MAG: PhzF family phenazine biosynthesis protein [Candidatus Wenzhouxiangella sp. M2_3B_020]